VFKKDTNVAHYNFNKRQLIQVIFGRDVLENTLSNNDVLFHYSELMSLHYLGKHEPQKLSFQLCCMLCLKMTVLWLVISLTFITQF